MAAAGPTVRSLDERVEDLETSFAAIDGRLREMEKAFVELRAKIESALAFMKWLGAFAAVTFVSLLASLFLVVYSAGKFDQEVRTHGEKIQKLTADVDANTKGIQEVRAELALLRQDIGHMRQDMSEIKSLLKNK
jgi:chromosome segregation ATPase